MMEINKHGLNLVSLYPLRNNIWSDKIFFKSIIEKLSKNQQWLLFKGRIPYLDSCPKQLKEELLNLVPKSNFLYCHKDFISFVFYLRTERRNEDILELMNDLWLYFEQPSLTITNLIEPFVKIDARDLLNKFSWIDITNLYNSFTLFRGIEENVLWIGKSSSLDLPTFDES